MSAPSALRPGQPVGDALREIAAGMVAEVQAILDDTAREPSRTVHDIRRNLKRWRALLRMLTPFIGESGQTLRHDARDLARKLTTARDAQSVIDAFQDAVGAPDQPIGLSARSIATIQARLEASRLDGERWVWNAALRRQISDYLASAASQVAQWDLSGVSFSDLAGTLARTYRRARRAVPKSWQDIGAEQLHDLRRRVVEHRYQMELVEPAWPRLGRIWVSEAQRLRNRLGKYQDLAVLSEKAAPHQPLAPWRAKLMPIIALRQAEHAASASRIAARLFAEPPKAFRRRIEALWEAQPGGL